MKRSLFSTLFFGVLAVLLFAGGVFLAAFQTGHWTGLPLFLGALATSLVLAAIAAVAMTRAVHQGLAPLQRIAESFPEEPASIREIDSQRFRDFDAVALVLNDASASARSALRRASESRRELEALLDSMQNAVVAVDSAGRIQWTNREMQKLIPGSSVSGSVRVGHALVQTIRDPEILDAVRLALDSATATQRRTTGLLPGRIFEVNASPMPGGGAVAVLHDITRIEQVERTQRDFIANVSHELRTPLTSITGYVETLLDHDALSPMAEEFLSTIHKNATRMNRLTEDLLALARVESSEAELRPEPVPADTLVRDAVDAMLGLVHDTGAELEIGQTTSAEVFADADSVLQVLGNLIENGIKYGQSRGSGRSRVVISAREVPALTNSDPQLPLVEFSVRDFGQGIASEHLSRIFERFYRVDKARSRESGGTGLGLAIARQIIDIQGGTIRAESSLGQGSTFFVTFPRATPSSAEPVTPSFTAD